MTDAAAKAALADFIKDVERVEQLLGLIQDFRDFAAQESEDSGQPEGERDLWLKHAHKLWTTAQEVRTDLPILSGSLLLYLCGRFEYFVRQLVGSIVNGLVDGVARFDDLPPVLRREYLVGTLKIIDSPGRFNYTRETAVVLAAELASNLAGNNDGSDSMRVDANAITITDSNMRSRTMSEIFKRVEVNDLWESLGKQSILKTHLGEATDAGCRRTATKCLDDIMSERNKVAHPTGDTSFPDADNVKGVAEFFRVLAQALTELALVPR